MTDIRITTEEQLRELVEPPHPHIRDKALTVIDEETARFLAASTFFVLATTGADGSMDVSPRGETPGGVQVLDDRTVAFVDRPGNRRLDSFRNILQHPRVGMLFIVPGMRECVRLNGVATLLRDPSFAPAGVRGTAIGVTVAVQEMFVHCGQALRRSSLWDPAGWPEAAIVPSPADLIAGQRRLRPSHAEA
ncbi:MSMEG_1061 family FMN-dependent PPOX-type flavoprotein [Actinoplanes rectilineatus]|uniref:MSMEG_1061 family FMN-dependent PPOX-type flavoprotein n=1 Tax=Actinoplanes rectilineatus TaxID=113571 RepID=UPI0005F2E422|nr:MSMEG_1061 family FMN-dependent PPOX-type flavoprotein [Actinoplanes rectilineatus]